MKFLFVLTLLLAGCSMEGSVEKGHAMECKDTRDGETFSYNTDNVSNVRVGLGGAASCLDAVDDTGRKRTLCSNQEAWLKCTRRS